MLGSLDATARRDAQLAGTQLRCWAAGSALEQLCAAAGVPPLELSFWEDGALAERQLPPWPLLRACGAHGVPAAALLVFTSEGDNVPDALELAGAARAAVPGAAGALAAGDWVRPPAWQLLFGQRPQEHY